MTQPNSSLTVVAHPLVQHKLSLMRDRNTSTAEFRRLLREISLLLACDARREFPLAAAEIQTPLERARVPLLAGHKLCLVPILGPGNQRPDGTLDPCLDEHGYSLPGLGAAGDRLFGTK